MGGGWGGRGLLAWEPLATLGPSVRRGTSAPPQERCCTPDDASSAGRPNLWPQDFVAQRCPRRLRGRRARLGTLADANACALRNGTLGNVVVDDAGGTSVPGVKEQRRVQSSQKPPAGLDTRPLAAFQQLRPAYWGRKGLRRVEQLCELAACSRLGAHASFEVALKAIVFCAC